MHIYMIMPAHKESGRIRRAIIDYRRTLCAQHRGSISIIIVTDAEGDTFRIVSRLARGDSNFSVMSTAHREGKGGAIIRALSALCSSRSLRKGDIVIFSDADDSVHGNQIEKLIVQLKHSRADAIIGSRYLSGSKIIGKITIGRYIASRAYNMLVRAFFGFDFRDTQCGIKLFSAHAICSILPRLALVDMSFDVNVLYELKVAGARIIETPITFYQRNEGSKVRIARQAPQMLLATIGFRVSRSRFGAVIPDSIKGFIYEKVKGW
ncbi:MAG: glycosyltransferase [Candidatus Micrarchaeia archaeon]